MLDQFRNFPITKFRTCVLCLKIISKLQWLESFLTFPKWMPHVSLIASFSVKAILIQKAWRFEALPLTNHALKFWNVLMHFDKAPKRKKPPNNKICRLLTCFVIGWCGGRGSALLPYNLLKSINQNSFIKTTHRITH